MLLSSEWMTLTALYWELCGRGNGNVLVQGSSPSVRRFLWSSASSPEHKKIMVCEQQSCPRESDSRLSARTRLCGCTILSPRLLAVRECLLYTRIQGSCKLTGHTNQPHEIKRVHTPNSICATPPYPCHQVKIS